MKLSQPAAAAVVPRYSLVSLNDECYPPLLREIHDPPEQLYVRGDTAALLRPQLAIVGSRRASAAALRVTELLASQLTAAGLSICSGLALGIDAAAHRGALSARGVTVAVTGTGIDQVYPRRHHGLAEDIVQAGCIVSEFPPGTPARKANFPQRNRIISGMSLGVIVVEAALRSGSLITARMAMEQGREVFALPWSMLHSGGAGCLHLLRDGARMVLGVEDVLDELGPLYSRHTQQIEAGGRSPQPASSSSLSPHEAALLNLIGYEVSTLDDLVQASGLPVERVLSVLSALEISGGIVQSGGGYLRSR